MSATKKLFQLLARRHRRTGPCGLDDLARLFRCVCAGRSHLEWARLGPFAGATGKSTFTTNSAGRIFLHIATLRSLPTQAILRSEDQKDGLTPAFSMKLLVFHALRSVRYFGQAAGTRGTPLFMVSAPRPKGPQSEAGFDRHWTGTPNPPAAYIAKARCHAHARQ